MSSFQNAASRRARGEQVRVHAHPAEDPDAAGERVRIAARVLEGPEAGLQKESVLRVRQRRLAGRESEEGRVEEVDVLEHAARLHVQGIGQPRGVDSRREQLFVAESGDGLSPGLQVFPELRDGRGAGESARHPDDRDRLGGFPVPRGGHGEVSAGCSESRRLSRTRSRNARRESSGPGPPPRARARDRTVGCSKSVVMGREVAKDFWSLAWASISSNELPPRSKKFWSQSIASRSRTDRHTRAIDSSAAERGSDSASIADRPGSGRPRRSTFPLVVRGSEGEPNECGGDHVVRKRLLEERAEVAVVAGPALLSEDDVGHEPAHASRVLARLHDVLRDGRMALERGFDLGELDPKALDLDLLVLPAQELEGAVRAQAGQIARPVQARLRSGVERALHEALRGQLGAIPVAAREAVAADVQLADLAGRHPAPLRVEEIDLRVGDRPADRDAGRVGGEVTDRVAGGEGRALRRAVAVDERATGKRLERPPHVRGGQRIAAGQELPQGREVRQPLVDGEVEEAGRQPEGRHAVASDRLREIVQPGRLGRKHDEPAAVEERAPDLEGRRVEGGRRGLQEHLVRAEAGVVRAAHQADDAPMHDRDALGLTGRAGRVEDVGQVERRAGSGRVQVATPRDRIRIGVETHERDPGGGQGVGERSPADQHGRRGILEQEGHSLQGEGGIHRNVCAPRLEHGEHCDDHLDRSLEVESDARLRPHSEADQVMGELVRPPIQRVVRQRRFPVRRHERDRIRKSARDLLEERRDRLVSRIVGSGLVPRGQETLLCGGQPGPRVARGGWSHPSCSSFVPKRASAQIPRARHCWTSARDSTMGRDCSVYWIEVR